MFTLSTEHTDLIKEWKADHAQAIEKALTHDDTRDLGTVELRAVELLLELHHAITTA